MESVSFSSPLIHFMTCLWYAWCLTCLQNPANLVSPPRSLTLSTCPDPDAVLTIWAVGAPLCIMWLVAFAKPMMFSSSMLLSFVFVISADSAEGEIFSLQLLNIKKEVAQCLSWEGSWCYPGHVSALINQTILVFLCVLELCTAKCLLANFFFYTNISDLLVFK